MIHESHDHSHLSISWILSITRLTQTVVAKKLFRIMATLPTEEDDVYEGLSTDILDSTWSDNDLAGLAQKMIYWEEYSALLGFSASEEVEIKEDSQTYAGQKYKMLIRWKAKEAALKQRKMADEVRAIILHPKVEALPCTGIGIEWYRAYLQKCYCESRHPGLLQDQWPIMKSSVYISLTMKSIEKEKMEDCPETEYKTENKDKQIQLHELFKHANLKQKMSPHHIIIRGLPGSGKTTLTWQASKQWAMQESFQEFSLLLSIPLSSSRIQNASSLADVVLHPDHTIRVAIAKAISASNAESVCFWFDGWDEMPQQVQKESFLASFIRCDKPGLFFPACTVVVTTRPESKFLEHIFGAVVEIDDLSPRQAEEIITRSVDNTTYNPKLLLDHIQKNVEVQSFCSLPINVIILVHLFFSLRSALPDTQTKLLDCLILNLLLRNLQMRWKQDVVLKSFSDLAETPRRCFDILCQLAFNGIVSKIKTRFSRSEISSDFSTSLVTLGLMKITPRIEWFGRDEELSFLHFTLQEFLVAVHLSTLENDEQLQVIKKLVEAKNHLPTVIFYAGLTKLTNREAFYIIERVCRERHYEQDSRGYSHLKIFNGDHVFFTVLNCIYEAQSSELCSLVKPTGAPMSHMEFDYWLGPHFQLRKHMMLLGYFLGHYCRNTTIPCQLKLTAHFIGSFATEMKIFVDHIKFSWNSPKYSNDRFPPGINIHVDSKDSYTMQQKALARPPLDITLDNWDIYMIQSVGELQ